MQHDSITITQPDDWHCHFRDGKFLATTVAATSQQFARAIAMPNLATPVTNVDLAKEYQARICAHIPGGVEFTPLMTLYLTADTTAEMIQAASESPHVYACKLYPAGATTGSEFGVADLTQMHAVFASMQEHGLPLLIHGEVTDPSTDIFDREKLFIQQTLIPITQEFPNLKIVLEHITTQDAVEFVLQSADNVAATITAHHLLYNRNEIFKGGINPHYYCLPVLKRESHRQALITAATSGNKKFFLGTDSAPHLQINKETKCGCAGIYTAHCALELYLEVFEQVNKLENFESFASFHGADFYGLERNTKKVTLSKSPWIVPESIEANDGKLIPLRAGQEIQWKIQKT